MNILLSLDDLFDTRLGTLHLIDKSYPIKLLSTEWRKRPSDTLIYTELNLDINVFKEAHGKRSNATLIHSLPTRLTEYINKIFLPNINFDHELDDEVGDMALFLNVYPYKLPAESLEHIKKSLMFNFPLCKKIEIISLAQKLITPVFLERNNIRYFFNDNIFEWINIHIHAFMDKPVPKLKVIAPMRESVNAEVLDSELAKKCSNEDRYEMVAMMFRLYVTLIFISPEYFSIIENKKRGS